jgi:hypothetical protein
MDNRDREEEAQEQRRPYEPPAIEETSAFETLALACARLSVDACGYDGVTGS